MMNYVYQFSLLLLSSVSLTSCFQETPKPAPLAQTNNIIYLQNVANKTENSVTKFNNLIKQGNVIVDFYADWCPPCTRLSGVIGQIAGQHPNVTFLKINVDMFPEISRSIRSLPTIVFYKNGQQVHRQSETLNASQMNGLIQKLF